MSILLVKLILMPLLLWLASYASWRWGNQVGGSIAGLPLTSAVISVFLYVERGLDFAVPAAIASTGGIMGAAAFALAYSRKAEREGWIGSLLAGIVGYTAVVTLLQLWTPGLMAGFLAVLCLFTGVLCLIPRKRSTSPQVRPASWDLVTRMAVTTAVCVALTTAASVLGPSLTGLLSPLPVISAILCCYTHAESNGEAACQVLRGMVLSGFAFAAFFAIVALGLPIIGGKAYVAAIIGTILVHLGVLKIDVWLGHFPEVRH